jgi:hypothetical protein
MDCKKCADEMTAFLDAELSDREAEQMRSHLNACNSCSEELVSLRESREFIESRVGELVPRPEAWNIVRTRISMDPPSRSFFDIFTLTRWRVVIATLALMLTGGLGYMQYQQTEKKTLEKYISKYVREREAQWQAKSVLANTRPGSEFNEANPFADNPFLEIKATVVSDNPFRSEDR